MKLMSLQEFYDNNNCKTKDISLYLNHVNEKKKELVESLDDAVNLGLSAKVVDSLQEQINFIKDLELIINSSYKDILRTSIDNLSIEDLKYFANKILSESGYYEEEERLANILSEKLYEKKKKEEQNKELLESCGYKESYYQAEDTESFFREIKSPEEYVKDLINSNMNKGELSAIFTYVDEENHQELADKIIKLRKIIKLSKSEDIINETISSFISSNVLGKIEYKQIFIDLQNKLKYITKFFKGLPDNLRDSIMEEGLIEKETYGTLRSIYADYQKNGKIVLPANPEIEALDEEINKIDEEKNILKIKISKLQREVANAQSIKEFIKKNLIDTRENNLSYNSLTNYIEEHTGENKSISKKDRLLSYSQDIQTIMSDENNQDLEIIQARNSIRLMNALGSDATEESIYSIYIAEERRLKQYQILVEAIRCLNDLKKQIDDITNSRSIFKNLSGANDKAKSKLLSDYYNKCKEYYKLLEHEDLLKIYECHNDLQKEQEMYDRPHCFEAIFDNVDLPLYVITETSYAELRARNIIPNDFSREDLNKFFKVRYALVKELFTIERTKTMNYMLIFSLDDIMLDQVIDLQKEAVNFYKKLYESRKEERLEIVKRSEWPLSKEMRHLIKGLNLDEGNITEECLEKLNQELLMQIKQIDEESEQMDTSENTNRTFDDMSFDDVKEYYSMLSEIYQSMLPSDEVKKNLLFNK